METQSQAKSKLMSQRDNDDIEQRKNQRLILAAAEPEHTTKIIDLNDDCLLKIFVHLDLQSLFNVAVANEWLRPAAREVYKRKFGTKMVQISGYDFRGNRKIYSTPKEYASGVYIYSLKTSLKYLRCFGPSVSNLKIDYQNSKSKRYEYVHQYINDYCVESLVRIDFHSMPNFDGEQFQKVFVNVNEVAVSDTILKQHLQLFAKWFPNLDTLTLRYVECGESFIAELFQHFEHLSVFNLRGCNQNGFVADLLRGANQLKTMDIKIFGEEKFPFEALLDMLKDKPLLTALEYKAWGMCRPMPVDAAAVQRVINEHRALIELNLPQYLFSHDGINALIGQLSSLKKFRFLMRESDFHDLVSQLDMKKWHASHYDPWQFNNDFITLLSFYRKKQ